MKKEAECNIVLDKGKYTVGYFDITKSVELIKKETIEKIFEDFNKFVKKYDFWLTGSKVDIAYKKLKERWLK